MKRPANAITVLYLLATAVMLASLTMPGSAAPPGSYFPLSQGATWVRETYDGTLLTIRILGATKVGSIRCTVVETEAKYRGKESTSRVCYETTTTAVRVIETTSSGRTFLFDPPRTMLTLPPRAGQRWSWTPKRGPAGLRSTDEWVEEETVTVPAGTFKAWKLRTITRQGDVVLVNALTWYALGVGVVKTARLERRGTKGREDGSLLVSYRIP